MAAKSKIARGALDALTDAYKRTFDPETYYHYSESPDIKTFDPKAKDSFGGYNFSRGATYFTKDKNFINEFFDEKLKNKKLEEYVDSKQEFNKFLGVEGEISPTVYPVKIKTDEIFDFENQKQVDDLKVVLAEQMPDAVRDFSSPINFWLREGSWRFFENEPIQKILKDKGYSGYKTNEPGTIALFSPDKGDVRSIFAKFDPAKSESGEILASVPAAALVTGGALSGLVDE